MIIIKDRFANPGKRKSSYTSRNSYWNRKIDIKLIAEIAAIIGSISIFLTLIFVIIEFKKNADQTKSVNMASRDDTATHFVLF